MCIALGGCHNRAYNDLYIENMASEIRDLEDQLYEFDYEYRQLEHELAALRAENARLRTSDSPAPTRNNGSSAANSGRRPSTRESVPPQAESILEPAIELPSDLSTDDLLPPSRSNQSGTNSSDTPPTLNVPMDSGPEFDTEDLLPPTIEPGEPMPPQQPLGAQRSSDDTFASNALELNLSRIEVPAKLASQIYAVDDANPDDGQADRDAAESEAVPFESAAAVIKPAVRQVEDNRVVELAFHPTLSRAVNFDDEADDDGLYLVLQPLNESGEMVPVAADLSVVILDPSRENDEARIGRRNYSANEVKAKMQAAGVSQGIHLKLPWNGPDPQADRVLVFVRYTFPDGRQVIGEKTFFVSGEAGVRTVWAPRSSREHENDASPVVTASYEDASGHQP